MSFRGRGRFLTPGNQVHSALRLARGNGGLQFHKAERLNVKKE